MAERRLWEARQALAQVANRLSRLAEIAEAAKNDSEYKSAAQTIGVDLPTLLFSIAALHDAFPTKPVETPPDEAGGGPKSPPASAPAKKNASRPA